MTRLTLAPRADLAVFYEADAERYRARSPETLALVTPAAFASLYGNCPSIGFECDGQPIGGILFDGEEAHIAVLASHHSQWALLLKPALAWLFGLRRAITVRVEASNAKCLAFMARNQWQPRGEENGELIFCMRAQGGRRKTPYPVMAPRAPSQANQPKQQLEMG